MLTPRAAAAPPLWWATTVLLASAAVWGMSWWPLKGFAAYGLSGAALVLCTYSVVGVVGLPWLLRERPAWRGQGAMLLLIAVVGGWVNVGYVSALAVGDVVRVMLLFYLSPVWSVLGGRLFLGEAISWQRAAAVALALAGAFLVVGGSAAFDAPPSLADGLALSAGLAFAANNIAARAAQSIPMLSKTVAVFAGCGPIALAALTLQGWPAAAWPAPSLTLALLLAAYAFGWTVLATATWQYGVTHMEAGRAGVILTAELLIALLSASLLGERQLVAHEWLGGGLIAAAALLEALSTPPAEPRPVSTTAPKEMA